MQTLAPYRLLLQTPWNMRPMWSQESGKVCRAHLQRGHRRHAHGSTELAEVRHTLFTIPKRLRVFFKYDRKLNTILFRAAWGALSQTLGLDKRELAAIFIVQTAGEALNYHPHFHGLLADGYWKDGVFTRFSDVALNAVEEAFAKTGTRSAPQARAYH